MPAYYPYLIAAALGVLLVFCVSRPAELRAMRVPQFILVPCGLGICWFGLNDGGMPGFVIFLVGLLLIIVMLAPNIGYLIGMSFTNLIDPQDWTPEEEEMALRPVHQLIDKDNFREALDELEKLLQTRKPTYEAVLMQAKLLNHIGRVDEALVALLKLVRLSRTTEQQLAVMHLLPSVEPNAAVRPNPPSQGARRIEIDHPLVLFRMNGDLETHQEIPAGVHPVEETIRDNRLWLKLAGEDWGNAAECWEAILVGAVVEAPPPKKSFFSFLAFFGNHSHFQRKLEARKLLKEANQYIRRDNWRTALPLLRRAMSIDPDSYEIAYRWVQAIRHTDDESATFRAIGRVLQQSRWTETERQMLEDIERSGQGDANR